MRNLIFSLIIAVGIHYFLFLFLPSFLINKKEDAALKTQSIMINMSYKEPGIVEKPVITSSKLPELVKKKTAQALVETPEPKTEPDIVKKVLPKELLPKNPKLSAAELQHSDTTSAPLLKDLKKQVINKISKAAGENIKISDTPIKTINFSDPEYRNNPPPKYPNKASKKGYEGLVELLVLISVDGRASQIKIKKSTGYSILDKQAIKTIQKWTFNPRINKGQTVEAWVMIPIRFKL